LRKQLRYLKRKNMCNSKKRIIILGEIKLKYLKRIIVYNLERIIVYNLKRVIQNNTINKLEEIIIL